MGKNLIQQARGKGGPTYRSKGFANAGEIKLHPEVQSKIEGKITNILKCPGHSAPLIEVEYTDGVKSLLPAPEFIKLGDTITVGPGSEISVGNTLALKDIPEGTPIFNIELQPGDGGKICRTGGSAARVVAKSEEFITILLPSKRERTFHINCRAQIGIIAGGGRTEKPFLKAGEKHFNRRIKNKRWPNPAAHAQNAVDHPYGNKRSSRKAKNKAVGHFAPPGRKVGKLWPKSPVGPK